jgi:hypothetical protein
MSRKLIFNHFWRRFHREIIEKRTLPVVHVPVIKLKINHIRGSLGSAVRYTTAWSTIAACNLPHERIMRTIMWNMISAKISIKSFGSGLTALHVFSANIVKRMIVMQ